MISDFSSTLLSVNILSRRITSSELPLMTSAFDVDVCGSFSAGSPKFLSCSSSKSWVNGSCGYVGGIRSFSEVVLASAFTACFRKFFARLKTLTPETLVPIGINSCLRMVEINLGRAIIVRYGSSSSSMTSSHSLSTSHCIATWRCVSRISCWQPACGIVDVSVSTELAHAFGFPMAIQVPNFLYLPCSLPLFSPYTSVGHWLEIVLSPCMSLDSTKRRYLLPIFA